MVRSILKVDKGGRCLLFAEAAKEMGPEDQVIILFWPKMFILGQNAM